MCHLWLMAFMCHLRWRSPWHPHIILGRNSWGEESHDICLHCLLWQIAEPQPKAAARGPDVAHVIHIWRGPMYYFLPERGLLRLTHRYKNKGWNRSRHVGGREWSSCLSFLGGDFRTLSGIIAPTTGIRFQFKANVMWVPSCLVLLVPCWPRSQPHTVLASFPAPYHVGLIPSPTPCWPHFQPHTVLASFPYCVGLIPSPLQKQWEEDLSSKCWVSMLWGAYLSGRQSTYCM